MAFAVAVQWPAIAPPTSPHQRTTPVQKQKGGLVCRPGAQGAVQEGGRWRHKWNGIGVNVAVKVRRYASGGARRHPQSPVVGAMAASRVWGRRLGRRVASAGGNGQHSFLFGHTAVFSKSTTVTEYVHRNVHTATGGRTTSTNASPERYNWGSALVYANATGKGRRRGEERAAGAGKCSR